jgi:hypothetical protein
MTQKPMLRVEVGKVRLVAASGRQTTLGASGCVEGGGFPQRVDLVALLHSPFLRRGAGGPAELSLKS